MKARGFGLLETIVGIALMLVVFISVFGLLRLSIIITGHEKSEGTAIALAQSQMEYLRGFAYDSLGTFGGIPGGSILQMATTTINSVNFTIRTFVDYHDDPGDGIGVADSNAIITDYKVGKVTVSYSLASSTHNISLVSTFVPPSIETSTGGGTLKIIVVNKDGVAVPGATVTLVNSSTTPTVNLPTFSNATGIVYLPGAATSSQYQVNVTKSGYSTAQTYAHTAQNANPTPGYLTVTQNQTTSSTFAIDLLGTLVLKSYSPAATSTFSDTFATDANLAATSSTRVTGGALTLAVAASSGSARAVPFAPQYLSRWGVINATLATSSETAAAVQVYDGSGSLISDGVLAGNSTGFTTFPLNLSMISTSTYPSLALGALLSTATTSVPSVLDWSISALAGPTPLANASFTVTGAKTIGTTGGGVPIYKTVVTGSTGAGASVAQSLEWDAYAITLPSYDLVDACPAPPYALDPGATFSASLVLAAPSTHRLLVSVEDTDGVAVAGASVTLTKAGFSATGSTSSCGNALFSGLSAATYTVQISKTGYTTTSYPNTVVSGQTFFTASFP